ncbi:hypothetical protein F4782DRAFT_376298 [Xylaria castorea]|nr:hypothetical protein F4782DRAFT_376298 [Xylaria castorea]
MEKEAEEGEDGLRRQPQPSDQSLCSVGRGRGREDGWRRRGRCKCGCGCNVASIGVEAGGGGGGGRGCGCDTLRSSVESAEAHSGFIVSGWRRQAQMSSHSGLVWWVGQGWPADTSERGVIARVFLLFFFNLIFSLGYFSPAEGGKERDRVWVCVYVCVCVCVYACVFGCSVRITGWDGCRCRSSQGTRGKGDENQDFGCSWSGCKSEKVGDAGISHHNHNQEHTHFFWPYFYISRRWARPGSRRSRALSLSVSLSLSPCLSPRVTIIQALSGLWSISWALPRSAVPVKNRAIDRSGSWIDGPVGEVRVV